MTDTTYKTLQLSISGHVAEITIDRPDKLNALSAQVLEDLRHLVTELREHEDVRTVILTGSGEKAFAAGADIGELARLNDWEEGMSFAQSGQAVFSLIETSPKPFIAAVNGFALGGGCELALACHIRICSENAKFGQPEVTLGIIPGYGGTQRLTRAMGRTYAADLILTGRTIDAKEAYAHELVSRVVPLTELMTTARQIAETIAQKAPLAIRSAIEAIFLGAEETIEEGLDREASLFGRLTTSADFKEGTSAFLEKRAAKFRGE
ncbi:MAG TPA: enoyl-CoA hydratase-related protein [Candidatus Kapabacteria bacterium]|jgi:enoyl-CoA hydratase|nr:enoyl-CoA hydratase-related protein [Candidatus Kapabacteria bacterium]